ncbi:hypothetical protein, partial [Halalkalibacter wakoensis]|uniref:hypothetical protein n=1 Tax=Halalkalibacter wakoensis TaxID=127891 RepID=UPI000AA742E9
MSHHSNHFWNQPQFPGGNQHLPGCQCGCGAAPMTTTDHKQDVHHSQIPYHELQGTSFHQAYNKRLEIHHKV